MEEPVVSVKEADQWLDGVGQRMHAGVQVTMAELKLVVLGAEGVGKTAAVEAFAGKGFNEEYVPTEDFETTVVPIPGNNGPNMTGTFWDFPVQSFEANQEEIMGGSTCVILAYDVTRYDSFLEISSKWLDVVKQRLAQKNLFVMLLGCKTDRAIDRVVSIKEAEAFASRHGLFFMEISAKSGTNVALSLTLLRIRSANFLDSKQLETAAKGGHRGIERPSRDAGLDVPEEEVGSRSLPLPPPPPQPPPPEESARQTTSRLPRQFALTAQISSSYDSINAILGRNQGSISFAATAKPEIASRSPAAVPLPSQRRVNSGISTSRVVEESKDHREQPMSPVFEQEYAAMRGMFDETRSRQGSSGSVATAGGGGARRASMTNHEAYTNRQNNHYSPYEAKSPDALLKSRGPSLDQFAFDAPPAPFAATRGSNPNLPLQAPSPGSPIYRNSSGANTATPAARSPSAGTTLLEASQTFQINGRGPSVQDQIVKVSPRKLRTSVLQEEPKKVPQWGQHKVKRNFGSDAHNGEYQKPPEYKLGYLPAQYKKAPRKVPTQAVIKGPPDVVMDVQLPNGHQGKLEIRSGDNARDLAELYVYEHSLRMRYVPVITTMVEERVAKWARDEKRKLFSQQRKRRQREVLARRKEGYQPTVPQPFRLNTAERSRNFGAPPEKKVIGKIHVAVGLGRKGTITVRQGDSADVLTGEFSQAYGLRADQSELIRARIEAQLREAKEQEDKNSTFHNWREAKSATTNVLPTTAPTFTGEYSDGEQFGALTPSQNDLLRRTMLGMSGNNESSFASPTTTTFTEKDEENVVFGETFSTPPPIPSPGKPLFNLDVNIPGENGESMSKRLTVRDGDNPNTLAADFVRENNLPPETVERLAALLIGGLQKLS